MKEHVKLGRYLKSVSRKNKGAACVDVYSVTNSDGFVRSTEYFSKKVFSKELSNYKVVERNMLAYNPSRINVGSVGVQDKCDTAIVSPLYVVFQVDEQCILPEYVYRFLKSDPGRNQIAFLSTGTVRHNLKFDALCKINIPKPALSVQKLQLATLNNVDCQIALQKLCVQKLDELVKSRFIEMFGDLEGNSFCWPILLFDDFAAIDTRMTNDLEAIADMPHVGIDSIESETGKISGYRTVAEDGVRSGKYPFTSSHIIYSKIRPALNKVALPNFEGVCSADAYPILPNADVCNRVFLAYAMKSQLFLKHILPLSGRAQMPKVNKIAVRRFACPIPPIELQQEFAAFVAQVDKLKFETQQSIDKLQMLYDSLAQEYFGI